MKTIKPFILLTLFLGFYNYSFGQVLTFIEEEPEPSSVRPVGLVVSPDDKHVYVSINDLFSGSDGYAAYTINVDGSLTVIGAPFYDWTKYNSPGRPSISPDGKHVYIPSVGNGAPGIRVFSRNATTGVLTYASQTVDIFNTGTFYSGEFFTYSNSV